MARVEEPERSSWRLVGRGREESTPALLHLGVLVVVGVVVGVIVGLVFLVQALA
jgi:hypothetical protein